jgi:hypothetical protein
MALYELSTRSKSRLEGLDEPLIEVVHYAIKITKVDFGVVEGLRSFETQKKYFEMGVSQTMESKHLIGEAVDLVAYDGSRMSWELPFYFDIAEAMREGAEVMDYPLRWGAAWTCPDIRELDPRLMNQVYIDLRTAAGRKPFIDAPHFEKGKII